MDKLELDILHNLYINASDVLDKDNYDHRHLKGCLLEAAAVLHKYNRFDDGQYALVCESLND